MTPSKPTSLSHYELLGVSYYASADDVRNGCERALAALDRMRPEGVQNDLPEHAVKRRDIMTAYLALKDGVRRNAYNATLAAASAQRAAAESAAAREREDNAGLLAPGWGQAVASPAKSAATLGRANTLASDRAHALDSSPILREAPVDLRAAAQVRDAERIRQRAARGGNIDDAEWADDATLGVRYVAMTLDMMVVFILLALVAAVRGVVFANATPWYSLSSTKLLLVTSALTVLYYAWGECGRHRATLGKRVMGLQVLRVDGVTGVGVLRAVARYGLRLAGSYALMLGYLMAFFTERKQALHDKLTDTVVVSVRPPFASPLVAGIGASIVFAVLVSVVAYRVAANFAADVIPSLAQAYGPQAVDPNRLTPSPDEVRLAYLAASRLQRAAQAFRRERGQWPDPAEGTTLINSTEQPHALAQYAPKFFPLGMFALSLGATSTGGAFLLFTPDEDDPQTTWSCTAMRIDADNLPNSCDLRQRRSR